MSEVQEICRLLDERGIKYELDVFSNGHRATVSIDYCDDCGDYLAHIYVIGSCVSAERSYLTPKMAVDAILSNTCHNVAAPPEEGFWPMPHFACSACGKYYVASDYVYFCPSCGRRVV